MGREWVLKKLPENCVFFFFPSFFYFFNPQKFSGSLKFAKKKKIYIKGGKKKR